MMGYLLDTNIPSELIRTQPNPQVVEWVSCQDESSLFISVITLGELWKGFTLLSDGHRRTKLETWFKNEFLYWFRGRILPISEAVSIQWGIFEGERQLTGRPLNTADGLIAATAFAHNLTIVTRNTKDFYGLNLNLLNPWEP
ncbi:MAG: type II toxin-antitoxin system VapC family toxin [Methylomonas sp.]|jgi:predicted nucleic acid-binding protein